MFSMAAIILLFPTCLATRSNAQTNERAIFRSPITVNPVVVWQCRMSYAQTEEKEE